MRGAFNIFRLFGIPVRVHWSFFLLFTWVGYVGFSAGMSWPHILWLGLFMIALFACVVLHEFGHALTARYYGIRTYDITLLPIGGVARLAHMPEKPTEELLVAIAGPAVNVVLGFGLWMWLSWQREYWVAQAAASLIHPSGALFLYEANFLPALAFTNLFVAAFNMLPAFPLDGGRVVRALLSFRWSRLTATRIAAYLGQGIAMGLLVLALVQFDLILGLISVFIFTTASREYAYVKDWEVLRKVPVSKLMRRRFTLLRQTDPAGLVLHLMAQTGESNFLIADAKGWPQQVLSEKALLRHLQTQPQMRAAPIGSLAQVIPHVLQPDQPLSQALKLMEQHHLPLLPVISREHLQGVLDWEKAKVLGHLLH